jgi:DNA-binding Lrp family transcriptional regulator
LRERVLDGIVAASERGASLKRLDSPAERLSKEPDRPDGNRILTRRFSMDEILNVLMSEARLSNAHIAKRLGKEEGEVAEAIERLEKDKVILGYKAIVDPAKTDDGKLIGIIEAKITPQRETGFNAIARRIYSFPEVELCYLLSGGYDLLVFVTGETLHDVARFVSEKLAPIEHVASTTTHFILKKYKESGVILDEPEKSDRLPISP